jgi:hypothetical protein
MSTFNGIGTTYYGRARRLGDTFVVTEWFTLLYFPIIPIRSRRVRTLNRKTFTVIVFSQSNTQYQVIEEIPLRHNLGQVFRTWCFTLVPLGFVAVASTKAEVSITAGVALALALAGFLLLVAMRARAK